jgi:hypothetical protein
VRQKLSYPVDGMTGNAGEDVLEPGEGINVEALAGSNEATQYSARDSCPDFG